MVYFVQSAKYNLSYVQFSKIFDVNQICLKHFLLAILAHELSSLEGKPDQYTRQDFPQMIKTCGETLQNLMGNLSQYMREHGGRPPRKGKISW